jgi:hypothetical protein
MKSSQCCSSKLMSGRRLLIGIPSGKHQHRGMALKGSSKDFRAFHTKANAVVLDGRNRSLRNTREFCQLILTEFLKLANDANRFANTDRGAALSWTELTHLRPPIIVCGDRHDLKQLLRGDDPIDDAILDR